MKKTSALNLTEGNPTKLILNFALPLLLGNLLQQFYNLVDTMIVGKFIGVQALAGVGATGCINFLIVGFCMGVCNGFVIPIAHKFGAKDEEGLRRYVANSIYLSVVFAIVITTLVTVFCKQILHLLNTPDDIFDYSYKYIIVIFMGIPATFLYNILSGYIRSIGDSKTPLIMLVISTCLNIILDCVFILVFKLGVTGAALATVLAQLISGFLCLFAILKRFPILHVKKEEWEVRTNLMLALCNMGIPMGLQYSITAIGSVILQTSLNGLGSMFVAASTAANKVSMFFSCPLDAMGSAMATYGGQNVGAKKLDRVKQGLKSASVISVIYSLIVLGILAFLADDLTSMFLNNVDREILDLSRQFLITVASFYVFLTFVNILRFLIQGMGYPGLAILAGVFEMIARMIAGLVFVPLFGFTGACFASPLAWVLADMFLIPAYIHVYNKTKKLLGV